MAQLNLRILPEETGKGTYYDSPNPLIEHALEIFGYTKINITGNRWKALKWGIIPIGGEIPWDARVIARECMSSEQKNPTRITVESHWFPDVI